MPLDRGEVGEVAARAMDGLEERFGEFEHAQVKAVFMIVAVRYTAEDEVRTDISWSVSKDVSRHEGIGLLEYVKHHLYPLRRQ
jgi:hypothetical protein